MSPLRARWNNGCAVLLVAGMGITWIFEAVDGAFKWLGQAREGLEISPSAAMAIKVAAVAVLGPLMFSILAQVRAHGLGRTFGQIGSFWMRGFRFGLICLLAILPWLLVKPALAYLQEAGLIRPDSQMASSLKLLWIASLVLVMPFWALWVFERLSRTVLGRGLFARLPYED